MKNPVAVVLVLLPLFFSCGGKTVHEENEDASVPIDPYADPPDYSLDPFEGFPDVTGLAVSAANEEESREEILSGSHYTVQVAAAASEENAESIKKAVSSAVSLPVFIDREGGYWKVRVGTFPARQDALDFVQVLAEMGFEDAWVTTRRP